MMKDSNGRNIMVISLYAYTLSNAIQNVFKQKWMPFISFISLILLFLLFTATPVNAGNNNRNYYNQDWRYQNQYESYRRYQQNYEHNRYNLRDSYYDDSYDDFRGPLHREDLIQQINSQGYYWVHKIRPSFGRNYVTALAYDRRYGGRSVYLRINQYNGFIFYIRYN